MNSTISDLWYGNICELEACGSLPHVLRKERSLVSKRQALAQTLTNEQQKLLDAFVEAMYENNAAYAEAAFAGGVRLGIRLCSEAWVHQTI